MFFIHFYNAGDFEFFRCDEDANPVGGRLWSVVSYDRACQMHAQLATGADPLEIIAMFDGVTLHPAGRELLLALPLWP